MTEATTYYAALSRLQLNRRQPMRIEREGLSYGDKEPVNWCLLPDGKVTPYSVISHEPGNIDLTFTDTQQLGPVVATLGQWQWGQSPKIPDNTKATMIYLWEHTGKRTANFHHNKYTFGSTHVHQGIDGTTIKLVAQDPNKSVWTGTTKKHPPKTLTVDLHQPNSLDKAVKFLNRHLAHYDAAILENQRLNNLTKEQRTAEKRWKARKKKALESIPLIITLAAIIMVWTALAPYQRIALVGAWSYYFGILTKHWLKFTKN